MLLGYLSKKLVNSVRRYVVCAMHVSMSPFLFKVLLHAYVLQAVGLNLEREQQTNLVWSIQEALLRSSKMELPEAPK